MQDFQKKFDDAKYRLKMLDIEISILEKLNKAFIDDYFSQVGNLMHYLKKNYANTTDNNFMSIHVHDDYNSDIEDIEQNKLIEREIKTIYKKLARLYHPDIANENEDTSEIFLMINEAYNKKDLRKLMNIENILCNDNHDDQMPTKYLVLNQTIEELELKKILIINSPAYILRKKVLMSKIHGYDLIEEIKSDMIKTLGKNLENLYSNT